MSDPLHQKPHLPSKPTGNVLVLGDNDLAALAIVRSLGRMGLRIYLVAWEKWPITRKSRYVHQVLDFGNPSEDPSEFVAAVMKEISRIEYDLVLPTSDKSLIHLMPVREEICKITRLAAPAPRGFAVCNDKFETVTLARRLGIQVPTSHLLRTRSELDTIPAIERFPLVLKPISSLTPDYRDRHAVRIVHSADELHQILPDLLERTPVLVQEFCPGYGVGLSVLALSGEVTAAFQHRRIHEPPRGGASSYRASVPLNPHLLEQTRRFCNEISWTGPAMFEFKVNSADRRAVLMEVNGRFWGSLSLAIHSGIDFPKLLYNALVLDKTERVFEYTTPMYARHTLRDIPWFALNALTPNNRTDLIKVPLSRQISECLNILSFRERYDLESITDPYPGLVSYLVLARQARSYARRRWRAHRLQTLGRKKQVEARTSEFQTRLHKASSILFVCLGNIHRSPVAAAMLKKEVGQRQIEIASGGFHETVGRPTTNISLEVAGDLGVDLSTHRSRLVTADLLRSVDLVLVMEPKQLIDLEEVLPGSMQKSTLLSAFDPEDESLTIEDPYGKSREVFKRVYSRIHRSVGNLALKLDLPVGAVNSGSSGRAK